jgi:hypothetical protein
MRPALAGWVITPAIDVRHVPYGFALRAAILAVRGGLTATRRMLAFFCGGHGFLPPFDALDVTMASSGPRGGLMGYMQDKKRARKKEEGKV